MEKFIYEDSPFGETLKTIKEDIKGTEWENHVFLVGGAVRDCLLGGKMKDIDLCVDLEEGGIKFAEWLCKKHLSYSSNSNPCVFSKYGTAKLNLRDIDAISKIDIECVQTRKEQYHEGSRNPDTQFGTLEEDATRRDLTINALYVNLSNDSILDPTKNGLKDLKEKVIRTPSNPNIVFGDDPLRMLRVIRFATKYGWGIEEGTWIGIVGNTKKISIISQERITDELGKILITDKPSEGVKRLRYSGLLERVLPEVYMLIGCEQGVHHVGDVFEHTMLAIDNTNNTLLGRWASLLHDIGKPSKRTVNNTGVHFYDHDKYGALLARDILRKLKFSNSDTDKICLAVKSHMKFKPWKDECPSDKSIRKFISEVGMENIDLILDVIEGDNKSHSEAYCAPHQVEKIRERIRSKEEVKEVKLPVNGKDIMERFNMKSSPKVGELLDKIKEFFLDNPNVTKEECLDKIEKILP
jgi:poly(A) polymerase